MVAVSSARLMSHNKCDVAARLLYYAPNSGHRRVNYLLGIYIAFSVICPRIHGSVVTLCTWIPDSQDRDRPKIARGDIWGRLDRSPPSMDLELGFWKSQLNGPNCPMGLIAKRYLCTLKRHFGKCSSFYQLQGRYQG